MRVGLLSDVHANLQALEAVFASLEERGRPEALWVTGDTVGYGGDPSEVLALLRARDALLLQGNHDRAVATGEGLEIFNDRAAVAARMHAEWLSAEERDFLGALPQIVTAKERFTLCHGSLRDPLWEYVTSTPAATASLARAKTPFACHGHTHIPVLFAAEAKGLRAVRPKVGIVYQLGDRCLLNPGSVGQPRDGDARAAFALLDTEAGTATFYRASYNVDAAQRRIRARGLPEIFADRLAVGV